MTDIKKPAIKLASFIYAVQSIAMGYIRTVLQKQRHRPKG